jgi:anion-transporting  ArsA/GET3 family ATPase
VLSPVDSPGALFRNKGRLSSFASSRATSGNFGSIKSPKKRLNSTGNYQNLFVQESAAALADRSKKALGVAHEGICDVTYVSFLEWIRSERLTTLPHKGSRWDRVLIRALYFAEQLHKFEQAIQPFAHNASSAATVGYGHAQLLLELSHHNSEALDKAFSIFYKFAMSFHSVLHRSELLAASPEIREQICLLYADLISLVVDVGIQFYYAAKGMSSGSTSLDIFEQFGDTIESFRTRQNTVIELIWQSQIENEVFDEGESIDVQHLSRWLASQDRVIAAITRDHETYVDNQAEFTCLWFNKHLTRFFQSQNRVFLVTGQSGAGKTTLAGSIVERLQRPMNRQQYDTLFCSLSPDIPTAATSLAVVKSLLFQLLNLRIGNMNMYWALFKAYNQCRNSEDVKAYEECLWQALTEALQHPAAGSNELVIVVDGLDEIAESKSASIQAMGGFSSTGLLEKLAKVTKQGRGVRLITMSSSVKLSSSTMGIQHEITRDDVRDDLHAVALRALMHNHHFHSQRALEQEQLLDRIIQSANGSFLRVTLICELLNGQKSPDALSKTMDGFESSKPSVSDLIVSLIKQLNPNNDAKTMLAWVLAAERPLTIDEIHTLFSVDVQQGTVSDKGINVNEMFRTLEPLFTLHQRIVRFKHPVIHSTLHDLAASGKVPIPLQDSETDLLLRVLAYTKSVLKDSKSEPTFEISDPSTPDKLFKQHRFLEYAVRYWVLHLQQSPLAPKESGEFKPTTELKKVFPDTTMLSILESNCWNLQLPIPQVLDLQRLVSKVRETLFTKNHPAVLQTYLSIATCYMMVSNTTQIAKYLYICTVISKETLSPIHPLTIECASQFLSVTETQTSSSRTEIMTHREQILMVLITAYEKQYGSSSELVIKTRQQLLHLYESLNETENALKISRLIEIHESGSSHSKDDYWESGGVVINQMPRPNHTDIHGSILGSDEIEEESTSIMTISAIEAQLSVIQQHLHRKEFQQAERLYVELWMEVSSKCRTVMTTEWHEKNIEIATSYSQFLKNQKRISESTAVLSSIWQQYESHQLSYSESIVSRLTRVAKEMRSMNAHAQALSIFKFASSYYHSVNRQETQEYREITHELSQTSSELVQHSLASSSSVTSTTTTISQSVFQDVFFTTISSSTTLESSTVELSKKLTAEYMAKSDYTAAINVIHATLKRSWSSFLASSIHDVAMATSFVQESVQLVERLAECYLHMRQLDKVDDVYNRFFRAVLVTEKVDQAIFEKAKNLLINFYDKHGYVGKAISVFQEILVVYRARLGHTHESTIQTLYILAQRCRAHPRNHGYWLDYYLQILVALNKESDVCHKRALDALQVVTVTYWEDRRYAEAVTFYKVLWNTFVRQNKEHKIFVDTKFVETLYERYYQCLEETKANWSEMYKVTKEYRETSIAIFGAESTIAVNATLSLAQVAQSSEQHMSEAISLYEAVSQSGTQVTTTTTVTEINNTLSSLYLKQMHSSSSSSMKSETISRALSIRESHFHEATQQYGYSHESSLTSLRELATLYSRQQKTDVAMKQISKTVSEIVSKETSSQKQIESAASIASTLLVIGQASTAHSMVQELHRQICAKDSRYASKWSFDLTKTSRTSLAFLASLQYHLRKDLSITFSEIYADLTMEYLYWVQFHQTLQNNDSLTNILLAAAPLRYYLRRNDNKDMISVVEDQAVDLFVKRDAQDLKDFSKESPRIFIIGILDYLGSGRNKDFIRSVILSSNRSVSQLTKEKKFREAYDIANLGFLFANKHDGYNGPRAIGMGFKLASLLVGRDSDEKCPDAALRKKMLALSNRIVKRILEICKNLKINFAHIQLYELSQLSALLGEQEDYETLEWLLTTLWQTRDAQRSWPAEVLLNLGRRLICARYLGGHPVKAIRLAEDIAYNMRRAHGPRAPVTIETYELLAQLYTSTGQQYQAQAAKGEKTAGMAQDCFKKAILVHEDILRILVNTSSNGSGAVDDDDDDDEMDTTAQLLAREGVNVKSAPNTPSPDAIDSSTIDLASTALKHLHLLKLAYQRFGGWPKSYTEYERLNAMLFRVFGSDPKWKGAEGTEKWDAKAFGSGKAESQEGGFKGVQDWTFGSDELVTQHQHQQQQQMQVHSPRSNGLAIHVS